MEGTETEMEMAERHVREGERHLSQQREILAWLRRHGRPTVEAERLLMNFEDLQRLHREHLSRLKAEQ